MKMKTYTGTEVDLTKPDPDVVFERDIFWAISGIERWNAHGSRPWSVGNHSLLVEQLCAADPDSTVADCIWALGHDFHEAYLGDLTRPVHEALQWFLPGTRSDIDKQIRRMKRLWDNAIIKALSLPPLKKVNLPLIRKYDDLALAFERSMLFGDPLFHIRNSKDTYGIVERRDVITQLDERLTTLRKEYAEAPDA